MESRMQVFHYAVIYSAPIGTPFPDDRWGPIGEPWVRGKEVSKVYLDIVRELNEFRPVLNIDADLGGRSALILDGIGMNGKRRRYYIYGHDGRKLLKSELVEPNGAVYGVIYDKAVEL